MTQHTPGPWSVEKYVTRGEFVTETCIRGKDYSYIAKVGPCSIETNAAFIVRACNSHEELLAALKLSLKNIDSLIFYSPRATPETELKSLETWAEIVRHAIAKAEGRT